MTPEPLTGDERAELEHLRQRVRDLERERSDEIGRALAAMATAQERAYWLDRWHVDLNALVETRRGAQLRAAMRLARGPVRRIRLLKRKLAG